MSIKDEEPQDIRAGAGAWAERRKEAGGQGAVEARKACQMLERAGHY